MPRASPIADSVVMSRWSSSRKISIRNRMVFSRSASRVRRSSGVSLGLAGGGAGGGWSENRLMSRRVVVLVAGVPPARRAGRSSFHDPHRWVAARRAGADAETGGDDVEPELPSLQLAGDGPA